MASLLQPIDEENDPTQAATTSISGSSSGTSGATSDGNTAPSQSAAPTTAPITTGQGNIGQITSANQGLDYTPLTNYVSNEGTSARNAINTTNDSFNKGLGTFTPFGTDQQTQLGNVLKGTTPLDTGRSMLNNSFKPTDINSSFYDPMAQQYSTDATALGNSTGISGLLSTLRPDLTPGDRQYDATVYGGLPGYQTAVKGIQDDANRVSDLDATTTWNAGQANNKRTADVNAFNAAAQGYVANQRDAINKAIADQQAAANASDVAIQNQMGALRKGGNFSDAPLADYGFDPSQFGPTPFVSSHGTDVFNQTVDPRQFLTYTAGQAPTANNVATQDQATQFNNAEALLNEFGQLTPSTRQAGQIGINQQALSAALLKAQQDKDAADAAWLAAQVKPPEPTPEPVFESTPGGSGGPDGSDGGDSGGGDAGGGGEGGGEGEFKGGFVKPSRTRPSNPLAKLNGNGQPALDPNSGSSSLANNPAMMAAFQKSLLQKQPTLDATTTAPGAPPATPAAGYYKGGPIDAHINRVNGGYVPMNTGKPNARDDISTNVTNGEFVTRQPSVQAIGANNLIGLNKMNAASPGNQSLVRNALHAALSRARIL